MLPSLPPSASSPYYAHSSFNALSPVALVYYSAAQLVFGLLRPTKWRLKIKDPVEVSTAGGVSLNGDSATPNNNNSKRQIRRKVAVVTGSNTGIGLETARSLVGQGYEVVLACRSRDKATSAMESISKTTTTHTTGKAVFVHPLDLSSVESVKEFSKHILQTYDKIDVLVNNAGRNTGGQAGGTNLDICFQTNHLGHFVLTHELLDALLKDGGGRVVNLSSVMHHYAQLKDNTPHDVTYWKQVAQYDPDRTRSAYTPSKLAALLFTLELNRRYASKGLKSIAVNPGAVNSDIWRSYPRWIVFVFKLIYLTSKQGSCTSVAAATVDFAGDNNEHVQYLQPYWLPKWMKRSFPPMEMLGPFQGYRVTTPRLPDDGTHGILTAQHLWKASEDLADCVYES